MEALRRAIDSYASEHANVDGLAMTEIPGVRMMCLRRPTGPLHSIYRPLVCLVLQGAKHMLVGREDRIVSMGDSVVITADMPVSGRIIRATPTEPYLAFAVELDATLIGELAAASPAVKPCAEVVPLVVARVDAFLLDCAVRLTRLLDRPEAIPLLQAGIMKELHYWLMSGPHGGVLRSLALPNSNTSRLSAAIEILRSEYRTRIAVSRLAKAAAMSLTSFYVQFKRQTSLTPIQFQKRLRLIEARRLMVHEGTSATTAAFEVGYESTTQFSREYARMFGAPPRRDATRARRVAAERGAV